MLSPSASRAEPLFRPDFQGIPVCGPKVNSELRHTDTFATGQSSRGWMWLMLSCTTVTFPEGFPAAVGQHLQTRLRNWDRTRRLRLLFLLLSSNSLVLCCANNAHPMGVLSDKASVNKYSRYVANTSAVKSFSLSFLSNLPLQLVFCHLKNKPRLKSVLHSFRMFILCWSVTVQAQTLFNVIFCCFQHLT